MTTTVDGVVILEREKGPPLPPDEKKSSAMDNAVVTQRIQGAQLGNAPFLVCAGKCSANLPKATRHTQSGLVPRSPGWVSSRFACSVCGQERAWG